MEDPNPAIRPGTARLRPAGLLPVLLATACASPSPAGGGGSSSSSATPPPLTAHCVAEAAVCAEQQRKRDERLKPSAQRVAPAGETPPTRAPAPEQ